MTSLCLCFKFISQTYCQKKNLMIELDRKGVLMQVSAISKCDSVGFDMKSYVPGYTNRISERDTSFNSLAPFLTSKPNQQDRAVKLFENINEWQSFCEDRIVGKKLDIIA